MNFFAKLVKGNHLSTIRLIVLFYGSAVVFATLLLGIPYFHYPDAEMSFIDLVFTAVSAVSVTGLTVVSTAETFNVFGKLALTIVLQLGGIGVMALGTFIWIILGKKVGIRGRQLIQADQNRIALSGLVRLILQILKIILLIELVGTIVLTLHFLSYFETWQEALLHGYFASVSATTNGGFDITGTSLIPFAHDYFVQFVVITLIILGAIGFPVLIEVQELLTGRKNEIHSKYTFTLFTKITSVTFFALIIAGWLFIFFSEQNGFFVGKTWHEEVFYSLFQSVSTRSGGLATMDVNEFTMPTLIFISFLMFIGASPSSVGGGIRTTTFAIMLLTIFNYAKGNTSVKVFGRELAQDDILRSFIVITTASMLCITAIIFLSHTEVFPIMAIVFEVCSAFGTTGLSMGITSELSNAGKIVIMILMFVGRIGIFSFLFLMRGTVTRDIYHYPKERVIIG